MALPIGSHHQQRRRSSSVPSSRLCKGRCPDAGVRQRGIPGESDSVRTIHGRRWMRTVRGEDGVGATRLKRYRSRDVRWVEPIRSAFTVEQAGLLQPADEGRPASVDVEQSGELTGEIVRMNPPRDTHTIRILRGRQSRRRKGGCPATSESVSGSVSASASSPRVATAEPERLSTPIPIPTPTPKLGRATGRSAPRFGADRFKIA